MTRLDFAHGTYSHHTGDPAGAQPVVNWQTPAVGSRTLDPEQAREFADWLEMMAAEGARTNAWLEFILMGEDPLDVADHLREAAADAEAETQRFEAAIERMQNEMADNTETDNE